MAFRIAPQQEAALPVKRSPSAKKPKYLEFIRRLPCCVSGQTTNIQAAHVSFANTWCGSYGRGKGTKAPDIFALPLHADMHAAQHNANERQWWTKQGIDPHQLCLALFAIYSTHEEYDAIERATARIRDGLMKRDLA